MRLIETTGAAEGVRIFIGAESELFAHTGCALVISPYTNAENKVVGAVGVIGPTRLNYARIIPMVDYTSKLITRLLG
jgi:heat-inducible transcriptional repressor